MTQYICNWHKTQGNRCLNRATQIILYGCLDCHLDETLLCYGHAIDWTDQYHTDSGYHCMTCARRLEAYELISLHKVKDDMKFRRRHPATERSN